MIQDENEKAQAEAIERLRTTGAAYVAIFGPPGHPTPLGRIVLEDLDVFCATRRESIHMDSTGRMDPFTTIYRDGKKAVRERIREMIDWSERYANRS